MPTPTADRYWSLFMADAWLLVVQQLPRTTDVAAARTLVVRAIERDDRCAFLNILYQGWPGDNDICVAGRIAYGLLRDLYELHLGAARNEEEAAAAAPTITSVADALAAGLPHVLQASIEYTELPEATDGPATTFQEHRRRLRAFRNIRSRRQQQDAEARRAEREAAGTASKFQIDWNRRDVWQTPDREWAVCAAGPAESLAAAMPCMDDGFLWQSLIWCVRNAVALCEQVMKIAPTAQPAITAYTWLCGRPLFRCLVHESIKRNLTFPRDVFQFLLNYVLDENRTLDGYQPWHDPQEDGQMDRMQDFLDRPIVPPEQEFGRNLRSIELE